MRSGLAAVAFALSAIAASCMAVSCSERIESPRVASAPHDSGPSPAAATRAAEMPFPARAREHRAVVDNAECERCHEEAAASWRRSLHHQSNTNEAYRRSFAIEPMPFCRSCHAPEAEPTKEESTEVSELGVGCVTCHVTEEGVVLAAPGASKKPSPHPLRREAAFAGAAACARCHEFAFPGRSPQSTADLMQSTITEHRASKASSVACASCHMPRESSGAKSHAFVASRDVEFVKRAVSSTARRTGPSTVAITLVPRELGHAFPTGDLFRRLEITAEASGRDQMVLASAQRFLTRHFELRNGVLGRRLVADDRVTGSVPATIELDLGPGASGHPIVWRVAYERVAHPNGVDDASATVEEELVLAQGELPP